MEVTTIGKKIKRLRTSMGMTQTDLAKVLNISPSAIGLYEQNRRMPSLDMIIKIAQTFEMPLLYFTTPQESIHISDEHVEFDDINPIQILKYYTLLMKDLNSNESFVINQNLQNMDEEDAEQLLASIQTFMKFTLIEQYFLTPLSNENKESYTSV